MSFTKGLTFGKRISVITYANNHFEAANKLKTKPFLEHFIKERMVKNIYIKSKVEIPLKILKNSSI